MKRKVSSITLAISFSLVSFLSSEINAYPGESLIKMLRGQKSHPSKAISEIDQDKEKTVVLQNDKDKDKGKDKAIKKQQLIGAAETAVGILGMVGGGGLALGSLGLIPCGLPPLAAVGVAAGGAIAIGSGLITINGINRYRSAKPKYLSAEKTSTLLKSHKASLCNIAKMNDSISFAKKVISEESKSPEKNSKVVEKMRAFAIKRLEQTVRILLGGTDKSFSSFLNNKFDITSNDKKIFEELNDFFDAYHALNRSKELKQDATNDISYLLEQLEC